MIKALVIDLDGTMYPHSMERRADRISIDRIYAYMNRKGLISKMPKRSDKRISRFIKKGLTSEFAIYLSKKYRVSRAALMSQAFSIAPRLFGIKRDERLINLLSQLSRRYDLWILTNGYPLWAENVLKTLGINKIFKRSKVITLKELNGNLKPSPEAFRILLERSRHKASSTMFIDDKRANILAARRMGIRSVLVDNDSQDKSKSIYSILEGILSQDKNVERQRR